MARRRKARKSGGARRRRRRRTASAAPRRRRSRARRGGGGGGRRRFSRNPRGFAIPTLNEVQEVVIGGLIDGAVGTGALASARFLRGMTKQDGNTVPGIAVEAAVALAQALILRRIFSPAVGRAAMQGVTQGIVTTIIKGANIPFISPALGDEGELPLLSGIYDLQGVYDLGLGDNGPERVVLPDGRTFQKLEGGYALTGDDELPLLAGHEGEREVM